MNSRPWFASVQTSRARVMGFGVALALILGGVDVLAASPGRGTAPSACMPWTRWNAFKQTFIDPAGRVVDAGSADHRTVSEGQAYGLFFALVANDRPTFDRLLAATRDSLARGDLTKHLPAWLWGRRSGGGFGVLDDNSASDADLWLAYSLLQAGRLWHERRFTALGTSIARQILSKETAQLPGLGWTILPGAHGFHVDKATWRLNPSYLPPQVLGGIAAALPGQYRWRAVIASSLRVLRETAPHGFAPDWVLYRQDDGPRGFVPDDASHAEGSYNAIRVYLWLGMLSDQDRAAPRLLRIYRPMADYIEKNGFPPEEVDTVRASFGKDSGNAGFSAAVVPFLLSQGKPELAEAQIARVRWLEARTPSGYYSQALSLFGLGWQEGRFRFSSDGSLRVSWRELCRRGAN